MCYHPFLANFLAFAGLPSLQAAGLRCDSAQHGFLVSCAQQRQVDIWNDWRRSHPEETVWLSGSDLRRLDLTGADLRGAHLEFANFYSSNLARADLRETHLRVAYLSDCDLRGTKLEGADLRSTRARGVIVDSVTHIWHCTIDPMTDFSGLAWDALRIDPKLKGELQANIADIDDRDWYEGRRAYILHLSDLHFGTMDDANLWAYQLAQDVLSDQKPRRIDLVLVSGDIASRAAATEYAAAHVFLGRVCQEFKLSPDRFVIVPGNHDLAYSACQAAYRQFPESVYSGPRDEGKYFLDNGYVYVRDEVAYESRFSSFADFYQGWTGQSYPLAYDQQAQLYHYPQLNLVVLGLNSAWAIDHHYKARASIHPSALANALSRLRQDPSIPRDCTKLAVWHHPLNSPDPDRITDHGFMDLLAQAGFRFACHGHVHQTGAGLFRYDMICSGRRIDIIGGGTFGAPVAQWAPGYPLQYSLLKLGSTKLTVETRARRQPNGAWRPDAIWLQGPGMDPRPRYSITI